jgi:type I restriction-modification system DNA methylase subunit
MVEKFRYLDGIYNSNLFTAHAFETWNEFSGATEKVIEILYGDKDYFEYDFSAIPADVLGAVYESYLGYKLEQSKKDLFGKDLALAKDSRKRKEHGIYYTPRFIVEYIVQNALGPILDKCVSVNDLKKIKVLDPACGSGSFLIVAFEKILKKYEEFGANSDVFVKIQVLTNNIFGVDLDEQAVELARLNLLLAVCDSQIKLPNLGSNIKNGNSLISGSDEELRKYFGENFRDKKPFNWQEQFPEVFVQGGFDCIIGNPPYVGARELGIEDKKYFESNYVSAKEQYDLYTLFIEQSIKLLRNKGNLSFIVPKKFLITRYGLELRKFICENTTLINFKDYSKENIFPDASVYPVVFCLNKEGKNSKVNDDYDLLSIFNLGSENKILKKLDQLKNITKFKVWRPLAASSNIIDGNEIIVSNREIKRYFISENRRGSLNLKRDSDVSMSKIIMKKLCFNLEAGLDKIGYYPINTTYCIQPDDASDDGLKYILGILNSKLLTYFVRNKYLKTALRGGFIELRVFQVAKLPIFEISSKKRKFFVELVDKILFLKEKLDKLSENSNESEKLKEEIDRIDRKIDEEVYKLYGLTDEEIKIVKGDK